MIYHLQDRSGLRFVQSRSFRLPRQQVEQRLVILQFAGLPLVFEGRLRNLPSWQLNIAGLDGALTVLEVDQIGSERRNLLLETDSVRILLSCEGT